jgi:hypothetical protein
VADDNTTVVELVKALGESVTFSEGLLDLAEGLLLRLENGERPSPEQRMHLRTGMARWRAGVDASGWPDSGSSRPLARSEQVWRSAVFNVGPGAALYCRSDEYFGQNQSPEVAHDLWNQSPRSQIDAHMMPVRLLSEGGLNDDRLRPPSRSRLQHLETRI